MLPLPDKYLAHLATHPEHYASVVLGIDLLPHQVELAHLIRDHQRVLCLTGHGVGKSFLAAVLINWWVDIIGGIAISTAPTQAQLERVLWRDVRRLRGGKDMPPRAPIIYVSANNWAAGYTATSSHAFQGVHSDRLLAVFDECVGIDSELWEAANGMMTSANCRWLAIGNPTTTSSYAFQHVYKAPGWKAHHVSAAEVADKNYHVPGLVTGHWVESMLAEYSLPSNTPTPIRWHDQYYLPHPEIESRVFGRWPTNASNAVCCVEWVDTLPPMERDIYVGADVALQGGDRTAIAVRSGQYIYNVYVFHAADITQVIDTVANLENKYADAGYNVYVAYDADGLGAGIRQPGTYHWHPHHGAERATDSAKYANRRAEVYSTIGTVYLPSKASWAEEAAAELRAHTWAIGPDGRRRLRSKDDIKRELGHSPDLADAIALTYACVGRRIRIYEPNIEVAV